MLVSYNVKLLAIVFVYFSRGWVGNTVWLRLQRYNIKVLAMALVYSGGGWGWESQSFLVQNCFLSPNNFHDVVDDGQ